MSVLACCRATSAGCWTLGAQLRRGLSMQARTGSCRAASALPPSRRRLWRGCRRPWTPCKQRTLLLTLMPALLSSLQKKRMDMRSQRSQLSSIMHQLRPLKTPAEMPRTEQRRAHRKPARRRRTLLRSFQCWRASSRSFQTLHPAKSLTRIRAQRTGLLRPLQQKEPDTSQLQRAHCAAQARNGDASDDEDDGLSSSGPGPAASHPGAL